MKTSDQIIEEWLVINCQAGDRKAFELLVKRWNPKMLARVYYTTKDASASKDIVQDAWITIIKKIKTLKDPAAFQGWSLRIATHMAINWIRSNQVNRKREDIRKTTQAEFAEHSLRPDEGTLDALKRAIDELPDEQKTVIQLFYQENLSINTISGLLGIPAGTTKSRLFRGREYLKVMLENKMYQDEKE
ncbi:RNA polymerase sigma-70 factor, ECF subfamily [Ekhidna lutea]|uniref:RNA polymerase sigma-70 factor, ECF subfamily n=1 Tax=Ekhidna lutea TaxID=447679 RepID=A0A239EHA5_EKHLU|nr:sigma-70 family RNA polymerase sigma factor [Ekhidna lutea]SNS44026.1 RNA polymerase sigma-70 factor, ECF subfamily [Ekhidna lutea]